MTIDIEKMKALAADLRKASGGRYKWYAMGRDESSYFMEFDWAYDADRWFGDQQKSNAAWIEREGIHIVKKLFQTELETNAAEAATAIDTLLSELEAREADRRELLSLLPGPYYMDPPDGGDVSLIEQLRRMAKDACRYRFLRSDKEGVEFRDGDGIWRADCPSHDELDALIDAALAQRQEGEEK